MLQFKLIMKNAFCLILILLLFTSSASTLSFDLAPEERYIYEFQLLPASNLSTVSSKLLLGYQVRERTGITLDYTSFDSPILAGSSYTITYRLNVGLEKWGFILPTVSGGWRFIYTPETDFTTPIDFGLTSEIELAKNFTLRIPIMLSLFSRSNIFDAEISIERKESWFGDIVLGLRSIKPVGSSAFAERTLLLFGIKN